MPANVPRLIAIGDVHGCVHALDAILGAIAPCPRDQLVFLGDLVDQGRDTRDVLDRLLDLQRLCQVVFIRGNHEEMMLAARDSEAALRYWENCGGIATLTSYFFGARIKNIPPEHWQLLDSCRDYHETDQFIFTHANYLPDFPMNLQPDYQLRWALFDPAQMWPHFSGQARLRGPHGTKQFRNPRPGLRGLHRHGLLAARLADGVGSSHPASLASQSLGSAARPGRVHASRATATICNIQRQLTSEDQRRARAYP